MSSTTTRYYDELSLNHFTTNHVNLHLKAAGWLQFRSGAYAPLLCNRGPVIWLKRQIRAVHPPTESGPGRAALGAVVTAVYNCTQRAHRFCDDALSVSGERLSSTAVQSPQPLNVAPGTGLTTTSKRPSPSTLRLPSVNGPSTGTATLTGLVTGRTAEGVNYDIMSGRATASK